MKYKTNDFELELPDDFADRSTHILVRMEDGQKPKSQPHGLNIVITREHLPPEVDLTMLVDMQTRSLEKSQKKFQRLQEKRKGVFKSKSGVELGAYEVVVTYEGKDKQRVEQHIALVEHQSKRVVVIVGTVVGQWSSEHQTIWGDMLATLVFE